MKSISVFRSFLRIRIYIGHHDWLNYAAISSIVAGALFSYFALSYLQKQVEEPLIALKRAESASMQEKQPSIDASGSDSIGRVSKFYTALGDKRFLELQVAALFTIAENLDLTLSQAEYQLSFDKEGQMYTYQVHLPMKGTYSAIRKFCEQLLLTIPFASLNEVNLQRDSSSQNVLEAKLHITFYLSDKDPTQDMNAHGKPKEL